MGVKWKANPARPNIIDRRFHPPIVRDEMDGLFLTKLNKMSELKVKGTVQPRSLIIAAAVINAANEIELKVDMLITSGNDSKHMKNSKHYSGEALDIRSKHLENDELEELVTIIQRRLGRRYQIIPEQLGKANEHIHIEYDPK